MGACTEPKNIAIVTELLKCDLNKFLRTEEGMQLSKGERIEMMIGAAKGILLCLFELFAISVFIDYVCLYIF